MRIQDFNSPSTTFWQANATDARGQVIDEHFGISPTLPAGLQTLRGFDQVNGRLDYIQSGPGANGTLQNLSYRFDPVGNLLERRDLRQGLTEAFVYDTLYRLDSSTLNGAVNLDLSYNAMGNITFQSNVGAYTYHPTKLHAVQSIGGGPPNSYDANGNATAVPGRGTASWYHSGLVKKLDTGVGYASTFYYGPDGRRFKHLSQDPSSTETTIYLGELVEKVTTGTATAWRHYIHAPTGPVAVHLRRSAGTPAAMTYYLTRDHLGSVDAITDASGAVQVRLSYSAFGQRRREAGWAGDPTASEWNTIYSITHRGYTFHEMLDDLDIIHMNGRIFDPYAARFASADPFIPDPLDPQSHNRYSYVNNNPLSFIDPSGFGPKGEGEENWYSIKELYRFVVVLDYFSFGLITSPIRKETYYEPQKEKIQSIDTTQGHDYRALNQVCKRPLTDSERRDLVSRFTVPSNFRGPNEIEAPGSYTVTWKWFPGGRVNTTYSPDGLLGTNRTRPAHLLVGTVERAAINMNGAGYMSTHGYGDASVQDLPRSSPVFNAPRSGAIRDALNQWLGPEVFNYYDQAAAAYARNNFEGC